MNALLNFDVAIDEANYFGLGPALCAITLAAFTMVATVFGHPFQSMSGME